MAKGVLLHIGAPKTGTTAIQEALSRTDESGSGLAGHGVFLPGTTLQQARAALALLGHGMGWAPEGTTPASTTWQQLVTDVHQGSGTAFISSEHLCEAGPQAIRQAVRDLGPELRVVLTLRPLGRVLPSAWQQYLKSGHRLRYQEWLEAVLAEPPGRSVTPSFWRRHDQAAVVDRWAAAVGPDRMTVVVLDPQDRQLLFRAFEDLLDLPQGLLSPESSRRRNHSMSTSQAELFRQLNVVLRRHDIPWDDYAHLVRYGAILRTVENCRRDGDDSCLSTPDWALARASELGRAYATRIEELRRQGLRVIGDPPRLAERITGPERTPEEPETVPVDVAVQALLGTVARATTGVAYFAEELAQEEAAVANGMPGSGRELHRPAPPVDSLTTGQLCAILRQRAGYALRWRYWRLRRLSRGLVPRPATSPAFGRPLLEAGVPHPTPSAHHEPSPEIPRDPAPTAVPERRRPAADERTVICLPPDPPDPAPVGEPVPPRTGHGHS